MTKIFNLIQRKNQNHLNNKTMLNSEKLLFEENEKIKKVQF
jgi:hypothetical protein